MNFSDNMRKLLLKEAFETLSLGGNPPQVAAVSGSVLNFMLLTDKYDPKAVYTVTPDEITLDEHG